MKSAGWRWLLLTLATVCSSGHAQITIGNGVFPSAGATLQYAFDPNPGPAITVTPPGVSQHWDFSTLVPAVRWTDTVRPASTGVDASYFPNATLVFTQNAPAAARFAILPGSNGREAYYRVTANQVSLLGFGAGSDASGRGLPSFPNCDSNCSFDGPTAGVTRLVGPGSGLLQTWAPKQLFDTPFSSATAVEYYRATTLLGDLPSFVQGLRLSVIMRTQTVVDGFGALTLPGGHSFNVLRERTTTLVSKEFQVLTSLFGWVSSDPLITPDLEDLRTSSVEQTSYRYSDATSLETLAITYSPIVPMFHGDPLVIQSVQFKDVAAPIPEPATAPMLLAGVLLVWGWVSARPRRIDDGRARQG